MKRTAIALAAALGAVGLLPGCADRYADGPPAAYADLDYDAWYDGYCGPFQGGFWAGDGAFWYDDERHHFHRDAGTHFRRQPDVGAHFQHIQGHAPQIHGGR